ncbi:MAG: tetratricopeptide repeat protein, partial [Planctomycetota bacterium]
MSRPRHQKRATRRRRGRRERQPANLDRKDAAGLLRAARAVATDNDAEAIDWAFLAMPDSIPARRLKIEYLLRQGDNDLADALIAQGLLQHPTNPSLALLRARRLYAQGETREAEGELHMVLAARPHHCGTLELAGRVSAELGDASLAVKFLRQAAAERAGNDRVAGLLVQSLIDAGYADRAAEALRRMVRPPAGLKARVLRAMGRLLEAVELLETASHAGDSPAG